MTYDIYVTLASFHVATRVSLPAWFRLYGTAHTHNGLTERSIHNMPKLVKMENLQRDDIVWYQSYIQIFKNYQFYDNVCLKNIAL